MHLPHTSVQFALSQTIRHIRTLSLCIISYTLLLHLSGITLTGILNLPRLLISAGAYIAIYFAVQLHYFLKASKEMPDFSTVIRDIAQQNKTTDE